jgi:hypothetical protein
MAKQHQTTLNTSKAYSMSKLANGIWGEDWDAKCFVFNSTMLFRKMVHDIYELNLKAQIIIQHIE